MKGLRIMADKGWIKLYRDIQDNVLWQSDEPFDSKSAWIDLLLMANHKDREVLFNGEAVIVKQGQFITSELKLAKKWHWSKNRVRRYLLMLIKFGMITKESTAKRTTITLVNYSKFQGERTTSGTTDGTSNETTDDTGDGTTDGTQTRNKRIKECKEVSDCVPHYSDDPERNAEIIREMARGAILLPDGKLDYSNVKHSWEI